METQHTGKSGAGLPGQTDCFQTTVQHDGFCLSGGPWSPLSVFSPANVDDNTLLNGLFVSSQPIIVILSLLGTSSEMTYTRAPCQLKGNAKCKASSAGVCGVPGAAEGGCHQLSHLTDE